MLLIEDPIDFVVFKYVFRSAWSPSRADKMSCTRDRAGRCRTPEEFAAGHLADAINIDYYANDFEDQLAKLNLDVPYVMYCNSGNRSSNALPLMDSLGFQEVYELDGGIQAWFGAGLPIEQ